MLRLFWNAPVYYEVFECFKYILKDLRQECICGGEQEVFVVTPLV